MDLVIQNALALDPESELYAPVNIGIADGTIAEMSASPLQGREVLDARGLTVTPGFIDIHIHEDPLTDGRIDYSGSRASLRMGVTTAVGGNCGFSPADLPAYLAYLARYGAPTNLMLLQGYNMIRGQLSLDDLDEDARRQVAAQSQYRQGNVHATLSLTQIAAAATALRQSMELGVLGLSLGLEYTPGCALEEMIAVCKTLREFSNPLIAVHYRYDADRALESIEECITLSRETGVPLEFSHIGSCCGYGGPRYMRDGLHALRQARAQGVDIMADCYPYTAFSTLIGSTVFDGDWRCKWHVSYDSILPTMGRYKNQRCTEEAYRYLRTYEPDTRVVCFAMGEENIDAAYEDETMMVASDGKFFREQGHARTAGTFPRFLWLYCREKGLLSLTEAIRRMTLLPAQRLHLRRKGRLQVGMDADLTILDPANVRDGNSFTEPAKPPVGIPHVIVGGKLAVRDGILQAEHHGRFIPRQGG